MIILLAVILPGSHDCFVTATGVTVVESARRRSQPDELTGSWECQKVLSPYKVSPYVAPNDWMPSHPLKLLVSRDGPVASHLAPFSTTTWLKNALKTPAATTEWGHRYRTSNRSGRLSLCEPKHPAEQSSCREFPTRHGRYQSGERRLAPPGRVTREPIGLPEMQERLASEAVVAGNEESGVWAKKRRVPRAEII